MRAPGVRLASSLAGLALLLLACEVSRPEAAAQLEPLSLPGDLVDQDVPVRRQFEAAHRLITELERDAAAAPPAALAEAYGSFGMLLHTYGYPELALPAYRNATRLAPRTAKWWHYLGHARLRRGEVDAAVEAWQRVLELEPAQRPARLALADALADGGRREEAESHFEALVAQDPHDPAALLGLGRMRLEGGLPEAAIEILERARARRPTAAPLLYALGMAYRDAGDRERARELLALVPAENLLQERALVVDPWLEALQRLRVGGRVHEVRGIRLLEEQRFAAAAVEFRQAMAADPSRTYSLYGLGMALDALGRDAEAEDAFRDLLAGAPLHAPTHVALARLLADLDRPDEARAQLRRSLEIDPDSADARFHLAHLDRRAGRFEAALEGYVQVARLDPARPDASFWVSAARFLHGDLAGAIETTRSALGGGGGDDRLRPLLARLLATTGGSADLDEAETLARHAWRSAPGASTAETLAYVHARRGRWDEASAWQEGVVDAGVEAPWAAERLAAYRRRRSPDAPWLPLEEWNETLVAPPRELPTGT